MGSLWAVVLAGGEGVRLRPLVGRVCGDQRPKQFCPLLGPRTLLRQTLERVGRLIPSERTVVVGLESHERYLAGESAQPLAVSKVTGLTWCDLGSPDRVFKTLAGSHISVPWLAATTA